MSDTADRLMDLAEERMKEAGYHGFSFRDLATTIGISSASVHHHFPTKADMVVAIMRRYSQRFAKLVTPLRGETAEQAISAYREAIRKSLCDDGGMCLSGILSAEAGGLPPQLLVEIRSFFREAIADLAQRIGGADAEERAFAVFATLEGAMILARAYHDVEAFDRATSSLDASRAPDPTGARDLAA